MTRMNRGTRLTCLPLLPSGPDGVQPPSVARILVTAYPPAFSAVWPSYRKRSTACVRPWGGQLLG